MTELDRMILAARQIGEVVGEPLLDGLVIGNDPPSSDAPDGFTTVGMRCVLPAPEGGYYTTIHILPDADALDLLTARVWRAVWAWSRSMKVKRINQIDLSGNVTQTDHGIGIHWKPQDVFGTGYQDLTSAVAAIHKHFKENS